MRKFILIAAMVLASATAQAGPSRSLTLASNDESAPVTPPAVMDTATPIDSPKPADAPKFVERPPAADAKVATDRAKAAAAKPVVKVVKRRYHQSTEARVINELHRYGIYW